MTDADRIEALESQAAYNEKTVQELSDALVEQQRRIDKLEAKVAHLLASLPDAGDATESDERPPHY